MTPSQQVRAKFARAHHHAAPLAQHVTDFFGRQPYEVYDSEELESGDLVTRVKIKEEPPVDLSHALGDAVHNARAALDNLMWHLILANNGTPDRRAYFPIAESAQKFTRARPSMRGAAPAVFDLVSNTIKPYLGGDDRFWHLHELDIEDKHHMIIPVGAAHQGVNFHFSVNPPWSQEGPIEMPPLRLRQLTGSIRYAMMPRCSGSVRQHVGRMRFTRCGFPTPLICASEQPSRCLASRSCRRSPR